MRGEKDGASLGPQLFDEVAHHARRFRIEASRWLIQEDHFGFVQQGAGNRQLLPHAFREAPHLVTAPLPQIEQAQIAFNLGGGALGGEIIQLRKKQQVLPGAEAVIQARGLGEDANGLPNGLIVLAQAIARHHRAPTTGGNQGREHAHGGRFARAIRPEETKDGSLGNGQRQVVHRHQTAEGTGQLARFDSVHRYSLHSPHARSRLCLCRISAPIHCLVVDSFPPWWTVPECSERYSLSRCPVKHEMRADKVR